MFFRGLRQLAPIARNTPLAPIQRFFARKTGPSISSLGIDSQPKAAKLEPEPKQPTPLADPAVPKKHEVPKPKAAVDRQPSKAENFNRYANLGFETNVDELTGSPGAGGNKFTKRPNADEHFYTGSKGKNEKRFQKKPQDDDMIDEEDIDEDAGQDGMRGRPAPRGPKDQAFDRDRQRGGHGDYRRPKPDNEDEVSGEEDEEELMKLASQPRFPRQEPRRRDEYERKDYGGDRGQNQRFGNPQRNNWDRREGGSHYNRNQGRDEGDDSRAAFGRPNQYNKGGKPNQWNNRDDKGKWNKERTDYNSSPRYNDMQRGNYKGGSYRDRERGGSAPNQRDSREGYEDRSVRTIKADFKDELQKNKKIDIKQRSDYNNKPLIDPPKNTQFKGNREFDNSRRKAPIRSFEGKEDREGKDDKGSKGGKDEE